MLPPVPIGPAAALKLPPIVMFPFKVKARTASTEFMITTNSERSAPIFQGPEFDTIEKK